MDDETQTIAAEDVGGIEVATGVGAANDAAVSIVETPADESKIARLERELREARDEEEAQTPQRHVAAAETAVAKAEQHLEWARAALAQAHEDNKQAAAQKERFASGAEVPQIIAGSSGDESTEG